MNTVRLPSPTVPRPAGLVPAPRLLRPERDFGIGYGRSSGYARASYLLPVLTPRFRCS